MTPKIASTLSGNSRQDSRRKRARSFAPLRTGAVVCDLVYAPLETELLRAARAAGHATADGLGMLLHQAVRGFSLWFGTKPSVTPELRALIQADLAKT